MTDMSLRIPDELKPRTASAPKRAPPPAACDCHTHISDAAGRFPASRHTGYTPLHATPDAHRRVRESAGLARSVGVQLLAYGADNSALVEALDQSSGTMRGVAEVCADVSDSELQRLHAAGVRGLRFFFELPRQVPGFPPVRGAGLEDLLALAPRMKELQWIAEVSAGASRNAEVGPRLKSLGVPIVLEHMAGGEGARGVNDPGFQGVLSLLRTGDFWVKLTICRMSPRPPPYEDMRPLQDALIAAAPDRLVWGSDWPHQGVPRERAPDVGRLLDIFDDWIDHDDDLYRTILSDNPAQLFRFPTNADTVSHPAPNEAPRAPRA